MTSNHIDRGLRHQIGLGLALVLLLLQVAHAASDDGQPESPQLYAVEIIVFEHLDQSRNTPEQAPLPQPGAGEPETSVSEVTESAPQKAAPAGAFDTDIDETVPVESSSIDTDASTARAQFMPLGSAEYRMNDVLTRLKRLNAYRPILHVGWIQPAWSREDARPKEIPRQPATGLSGKVILFKERFLHLVVDMKLGEVQDSRAGRPPDPATTVINESRRLRSDKPQYFDNPRFGVLAKVWKLPQQEAAR